MTDPWLLLLFIPGGIALLVGGLVLWGACWDAMQGRTGHVPTLLLLPTMLIGFVAAVFGVMLATCAVGALAMEVFL